MEEFKASQKFELKQLLYRDAWHYEQLTLLIFAVLPPIIYKRSAAITRVRLFLTVSEKENTNTLW